MDCLETCLKAKNNENLHQNLNLRERIEDLNKQLTTSRKHITLLEKDLEDVYRENEGLKEKILNQDKLIVKN